ARELFPVLLLQPSERDGLPGGQLPLAWLRRLPPGEVEIHIARIWSRRPVQFAVPVFVFEQGMSRHLPPKLIIERKRNPPKESVKRMFAHGPRSRPGTKVVNRQAAV